MPSDYRSAVFEQRRCKDCGKTFEITRGEKDFFKSKNINLPTRCEVCRKKPRTTSPRPIIPQQPPQPKKSGWCFITTAVCEYLGKPDDCFDLATLRNFRDNRLALQPEGTQEIREYYEITPTIVEKLAASDEKYLLYEKIRLEYIEPCFEGILHGRNENCRERYRAMVAMLKQRFLTD